MQNIFRFLSSFQKRQTFFIIYWERHNDWFFFINKFFVRSLHFVFYMPSIELNWGLRRRDRYQPPTICKSIYSTRHSCPAIWQWQTFQLFSIKFQRRTCRMPKTETAHIRIGHGPIVHYTNGASEIVAAAVHQSMWRTTHTQPHSNKQWFRRK